MANAAIVGAIVAFILTTLFVIGIGYYASYQMRLSIQDYEDESGQNAANNPRAAMGTWGRFILPGGTHRRALPSS
ncbi:hypothetical protein MMC25_001116 [Agyrium rufum]|nr:hypothetical protein [Agyrium rufum]